MLTISIPDEIDQQLSSITGDKTEFIIAAQTTIMVRKKLLSPEQLAEEYNDSIEENAQITKDFAHADNLIFTPLEPKNPFYSAHFFHIFEPNRNNNRLMTYVWQHPDWPAYRKLPVCTKQILYSRP